MIAAPVWGGASLHGLTNSEPSGRPGSLSFPTLEEIGTSWPCHSLTVSPQLLTLTLSVLDNLSRIEIYALHLDQLLIFKRNQKVGPLLTFPPHFQRPRGIRTRLTRLTATYIRKEGGKQRERSESAHK